MQVHFGCRAAGGPTKGIKYRKPEAWAPRLPIRFDQLVDHISQGILHRKATPTLVRACCEAHRATRQTRGSPATTASSSGTWPGC